MNKLKSKRKKAEVGIDLQQPQMDDDDRAPQPTKLFAGDLTSAAALLQEKMEAAARIVVEEWLVKTSIFYDDLHPYLYCIAGNISLRQEELHLYHFCTPSGSVFFRLNGEWIRVTEESFKEALIESGVCTTGWLKRVSPSWLTFDTLMAIRRLCKRKKRVNWVLPKLGRKKGGAVV